MNGRNIIKNEGTEYMEKKIKLPILRSSYVNLTKSEKKIADYILIDTKKFIEQTVSEIADTTDSSEITVSRFCKKLGYSGLQSLKIAVAGEMYSNEETVYKDINIDDSCEIVAGKVFKNIIDGLHDTLKLLNFDDVKNAVDILNKAKRIVAYGLGNSAMICKDIETRFLRFNIPVQAYADSHQQFTSASLLTIDDVVIAVSHTGASLDILESVKIAKENKAKVIAITSYANSPLAKLADVTLTGMGREVHYRSEAVASRIVHIAIVDLLYTGLAMKNHDAYIGNMNKMRKVIAKKRI